MTAALLSAEEYLATAETRPRWTQLINGEVHVNTPTVRHQRIGRRLTSALATWAESTEGSGEAFPTLDLRTSKDSVLAPDGVWMLNAPADAIALTSPPELVFEVRSPTACKFTVGQLRRAQPSTWPWNCSLARR
jgi:Uma2 family endonuclease